MVKVNRLNLEELLLKEKFVTEEDLKKAKNYQKQYGGNLTNILIKLGFINEEQLVIALAKQLGIPHVKLSNYKLDPEVVEILPENVIRREKVIPLAKSGNVLTIATADPLNVLLIDSLRARTGYEIQTIVATPTEIEQAIADYFSSKAEKDLDNLIQHSTDEDNLTVVEGEERVDLDRLLQETEQAPIIKMVNMILSRGIRERASDIHIEPFEEKLQVRYRIDGILYPSMNLPKRVQNAVISRIKVLSEMDIAERRLPQDGRFRVKAYNRDIDFRVSTIPTRFGEKVVLRLLDKAQLIGLTIDKLGLEKDVLEKYQRAIKKPYGMIVLTGPTSSGKSTSLYAAIKAINTPDKNILTIEDPVEYEAEGVNQVQVNEEIGLTFSRALRAFLRQDPDIIMLGEMRDAETADIGIKAALTGHLLFTTLHTNNAPGAITRLLNMGIEPFLIAGALIFVGAQRLMRRVCKKCAEPYTPTPELLEELGIEEDAKDLTFYRAKGCDACNNTGYRGRMAVMEALEVDDDIRELIIKRAPEIEIRKVAIEKGMVPLRRNALAKVLKGESTVEELGRITGIL
ncbi:MAG TPA: type II secretion system protein GspE [Candidatus Aerophobetes bacterium]|uniref:Type II secretion system protein GspE n=2 Tax=Aerophobetes bacterium TaxID=2030807 RepID=A0A7V0N086_UNCAE|nr:type II secretion system protein GspE [Candidatus Aerophobetes bacterium]